MFFLEVGKFKPFEITTESRREITLEEAVEIEKQYPDREPIYEYNFSDYLRGCSFEELELIYDSEDHRYGTFKMIISAPNEEDVEELISDYGSCLCM